MLFLSVTYGRDSEPCTEGIYHAAYCHTQAACTSEDASAKCSNEWEFAGNPDSFPCWSFPVLPHLTPPYTPKPLPPCRVNELWTFFRRSAIYHVTTMFNFSICFYHAHLCSFHFLLFCRHPLFSGFLTLCTKTAASGKRRNVFMTRWLICSTGCYR